MNARPLESALLGIAALGALLGCNQSTAAKAPPPPEVVVASVGQQAISIEREFTARTEAVPTVEVRARIPGMLEQVLFKEGSEAKQGQVLFVIQEAEYQAALETAKAQLAKAQADLTRARDISVIDRARANLAQRQADLEKARADVARYRPLVEARAIPQQDLDTSLSSEKVAVAAVDAAAAQLKDAELSQRTQIQLAQAAVEAGKAAVIQANLNLGYTTVRSPITGIIGKVMVDRGNLVGKSEPTLLATVSSVDPIYVDFSVSEADYLRLANRVRLDPQGRPRGDRQPLNLVLGNDQALPQKGHIVFVDRAVDNKTGTIAVRAEFPNPDKVIRPGQFARVRGIVEQRADAVLVPQLALQEQQGAKIALVVETGDKVAMRTVVVEDRIGDFYLVKSGLQPGERVIVEGIQKVRPGMQVKAVSKPAPKPGE